MAGFRPKYLIKPFTQINQDIMDVVDKNSFVLKPYSDPAAWMALLEYSNQTKNEELKKDIIEILKDAAEKIEPSSLGDEGKYNVDIIDDIKKLSKTYWR